MKRFIGVFTMSHENKGVRALPPETFETGERFRTPFLVCEDLYVVAHFIKHVHTHHALTRQQELHGVCFPTLLYE